MLESPLQCLRSRSTKAVQQNASQPSRAQPLRWARFVGAGPGSVAVSARLSDWVRGRKYHQPWVNTFDGLIDVPNQPRATIALGRCPKERDLQGHMTLGSAGALNPHS